MCILGVVVVYWLFCFGVGFEWYFLRGKFGGVLWWFGYDYLKSIDWGFWNYYFVDGIRVVGCVFYWC